MIIGKPENEQSILINKEGTKKTRILFGDRITKDTRVYNSKKVSYIRLVDTV